jgi:hypothetical protein
MRSARSAWGYISAGKIPEDNLKKDGRVTLIKDGTPWPASSWGGRREGAGRKKPTTEKE